jgi:hypothetical protein
MPISASRCDSDSYFFQWTPSPSQYHLSRKHRRALLSEEAHSKYCIIVKLPAGGQCDNGVSGEHGHTGLATPCLVHMERHFGLWFGVRREGRGRQEERGRGWLRLRYEREPRRGQKYSAIIAVEYYAWSQCASMALSVPSSPLAIIVSLRITVDPCHCPERFGTGPCLHQSGRDRSRLGRNRSVIWRKR